MALFCLILWQSSSFGALTRKRAPECEHHHCALVTCRDFSSKAATDRIMWRNSSCHYEPIDDPIAPRSPQTPKSGHERGWKCRTVPAVRSASPDSPAGQCHSSQGRRNHRNCYAKTHYYDILGCTGIVFSKIKQELSSVISPNAGMTLAQVSSVPEAPEWPDWPQGAHGKLQNTQKKGNSTWKNKTTGECCCPNRTHLAVPHSPAGDQCIPHRRSHLGKLQVTPTAAPDAPRTWILPEIPSPWEGTAWRESREVQEGPLFVCHTKLGWSMWGHHGWKLFIMK